MKQEIYRIFSFCAAAIVAFLGAFYLFWWYWTQGQYPQTIAISYPGCYAFMLIGIGLYFFTLQKKNGVYRIAGAGLCLIVATLFIYYLFLQGSFLSAYPFFSSYPNPLNMIGFGLIGTVFCTARQGSASLLQHLYGFLVSFTCIGLALLGLLLYFHGLNSLHGNTHLFGLVGLMVGSLGLVASFLRSILEKQINLHRWLPFVIGASLCVFVSFLAVSLQLSRETETRFTDFLIWYAAIGGAVFSGLAALLVYLLLQSKRELRQRIDMEEREKISLELAEVGIWRWDIQKDRVYLDDIMHKLFGLPPRTFTGCLKDIMFYLPAQDRDQWQAEIDKSLQYQLRYEQDMRVVWPDHSIHVLHVKGKCIVDAEGSPYIMLGAAIDVTENKNMELSLRLSDGVAKILASASTIQEASKKLMGLFHHLLGWQVLMIWRKTEQGLKCLIAQSIEDSDLSQFLQQKQQICKEGCFWRIIEQELRPMAFEDISKLNTCACAEIAQQSGVRGSFAFPVQEQGRFFGMVELFKKDLFEPKFTSALTDLWNKIGGMIGEFIQKKEKERAFFDLAKIVMMSPQPIYSCSLDGIILSWNQGAEQTFGWKEEEIIGKSIKELYPQDLYSEFHLLIREFHEGKDLIRIHSQRVTKTGELRFVQNMYFILSNGGEHEKKVAVIVNDITEEMQAQEALDLIEKKYRDFVESTEDWIWEMNLKGVFTYSNPAVIRILGYSPEEIVGQAIYFFVPEGMKQEVHQELENSIYTERAWKHRLFTWKDKHGRDTILESTAMPIFDKQKKLIGFRGVDRDVTEREKIEQTKNEFIAKVSHEIRTPLTAIHAALGLLAVQQELSSKAQDLVKLAYRNSSCLIDLIRDIIDVEKIALGEFAYKLEKIPLADIVYEALESLKIMFEESKVEILAESMIPDAIVNVDRDRLHQVLFNLLSNAIHVSVAHGKVVVSMERQGRKVRVSVHDEGPGISEEFQTRIFGLFQQAPRDRIQGKSSGLGLNISKSIIEHMGGSMGFTSQPGKGATFYFDLPEIQ